MRKTYLLLMICCAVIACKKNNVDFSFSPTSPRAGESVSFSNLSESGEEWSWSFGDGATSTLKSPTHAYKQPGTYRVTLQVDKKSSWSATKEITIHDTIPTFSCEDTEFTIYKDYTFNAVVYNPYNYDVTYQWALPINTPYAVITDTAMNKSSLHLYFIQPMEAAPIELRIVLNGKETIAKKTFTVSDRKTNSVLLRTDEGDFRQRIFGERAEMALPVSSSDTTAKRLLDKEQDTVQTYNGRKFRLDSLAGVYAGMKGFHIASRKIYYRAAGLWVVNIDGSYCVQIDTAACEAMTLDTQDNRIYWANQKGVWYMPFVGTDNNRFVTVPVQLNTMQKVEKITADNTIQ